MTAHGGPATTGLTMPAGCVHWFYWINPADAVAYCQDCPHAWTLARSHAPTATSGRTTGRVSSRRGGDQS